MASDLLELTRQIQQAPIIGAGLADSLIGSYRKGQEIEQARREMEAQQQLRALFARGQQPSMGEIGQYAPELAMKYNPMGLENLKLQSEIMKSQQQMAESQQKQEFERLNRQGQAVVPLIDEYHMMVQQGMPEMQAQERFRARLGQLIPALEQAGIGFKAGLTGNVTPEQFEQIYAGVNAPTMRLQSMMEQQKARAGELGRSSVMPRMTPEQTYGDYVQMPNGQFIRKPSLNQGGGLGGGMGDMGDGMRGTGASVMMRLSDKQLTDLANNNKMPAEQQMAIAEIERRYPNMQTINESSTGGMGNDLGITTPEQYQKDVIKQEVEKTTAKKEAELKVADKQALNKNVNIYQEIPDIKRIDNLIDNSIGGDIDYWLNRIGGVAGESLKKGDNTAALDIIAGQLVQTAEKMPGAESDADLRAKIASVGAINQIKSPDSRKAAIHELVNYMDRKIANRIDDLDISESQAVRMAREGKISKATLAEIHRRHGNKWGQQSGR